MTAPHADPPEIAARRRRPVHRPPARHRARRRARGGARPRRGDAAPRRRPAPRPRPADPRATQYLVGSAGEGLRVGDRAPELEIVGPDGAPAPLRDLDGNPVRLADLRGRPVWINFWASWCPPCQAETPTIRDTAAAYAPQGLEVVGISVQEATEDDVRAYAEKYDLGYTVAADLAGDVFRRYRVFGLPDAVLPRRRTGSSAPSSRAR